MDINKIQLGDNVLITSDSWFYAPNGLKYRSIWGTLNGIYDDKQFLGIKTNARSSNWYVQVGNHSIAGCQIHHVIKTDNAHFGEVDDVSYNHEGAATFKRPSEIYNANKEYK